MAAPQSSPGSEPSPEPGLLEKLRKQQWELREEFDALVRCLDNRGVVSQAAVSNERFRSLKRRFPATGPTASLVDALEAPVLGLLHVICALCGEEDMELRALLRLKQLCSRCRASIDPLQVRKLYVFGGSDAQCGTSQDSAEAFDSRQERWTAVPSKKFKRVGCVAGALGGRVYVCGGPAPTGTVVDRFNPKTQAWEYRGVPQMRCHRALAAAAVFQGRFYVCGGEDTSKALVHASAEYLDLSLAEGQGAWVLHGCQMSVARRSFAAAVVTSPELCLLVCGGMSASLSSESANMVQGSVEALAPVGSEGSWELLPSMDVPRYSHCAAAGRGCVYVCGGNTGDWRPSAVVERFDMEGRVWRHCTPLPIGRADPSMVFIGTRLYVFGGIPSYWPGTRAFNSVLCLDSDNGEWEHNSDMLQGRQIPAAALLQIGVLASAKQ